MRIAYQEMALKARSEETLQDIAAINRLLRQLSSRATEVDWHAVIRVLHDGVIVLARDLDAGGQVVGMGTILFGYKLTASFASIEDVVVDENYRRRGIGQAITLHLLTRAKERRLTYVDLTSSPRRIAANSLYKKLGFAMRETNPFRLSIQGIPDVEQEEKHQAAALG